MKGPDGFVQAYNAQVAVDVLQLIVGQAVTQETNGRVGQLSEAATFDRHPAVLVFRLSEGRARQLQPQIGAVRRTPGT